MDAIIVKSDTALRVMNGERFDTTYNFHQTATSLSSSTISNNPTSTPTNTDRTTTPFLSVMSTDSMTSRSTRPPNQDELPAEISNGVDNIFKYIRQVKEENGDLKAKLAGIKRKLDDTRAVVEENDWLFISNRRLKEENFQLKENLAAVEWWAKDTKKIDHKNINNLQGRVNELEEDNAQLKRKLAGVE